MISDGNKDYVIYSLLSDDVVRFKTSREIIIYGNIVEAREDAKKLGAGFFVHKAIDSLPYIKKEINNQLKQQ